MSCVTRTEIPMGAWRSNGDRRDTEAQLNWLFGRGWYLEYDHTKCKDILNVDWRCYTGVTTSDVVVDFGHLRVALKHPVISPHQAHNVASGGTASINTSSTTNSSKKLLLL